jgi:hypothetical protein
MNFKIKFNGCDLVSKNYSQSSQDIFVLSCLNGKRNGTFLDLGSNHSVLINNTYLLEDSFGWSGVSIDIDNSHAPSYSEHRKTKFLNLDCTNLDFNEISNYYDSNHIDYLSVDLEPASITLKCLYKIPFDKLEFSIITYEHDSYRFGDVYKLKSREFIESFGYKRICSNVSDQGNPYEDWYYNPKYISYSDIKELESENQQWSDILYSSR